MKNEEAKFLLGAYRPNGSDAVDEKLTEALTRRGLKIEPEPEAESDFGSDKLLAMTAAGRAALVARGLRNSEIESLLEDADRWSY